jgi:hypothetical protein
MSKRLNLVTLALAITIGCASTKQPDVITFSPITVDKGLIEKKDYSNVITVVNAQYDGGHHSFSNVEVVREETIYLTLKLTSDNTAEGCCKVSVDKNRSAIVSMQPDCPVGGE